MIEIDYSDPVVQRIIAVNEAVNASCAESMERTAAEHAESMDRTLSEGKEKVEQAEAFYAAQHQRRQGPSEDPHRWPERERRNKVLSFRGDDERPTPAPPPPTPPPPPPAPPPPPPKPAAPERPRKSRVVSFGPEDDDEGFQGFGRRR